LFELLPAHRQVGLFYPGMLSIPGYFKLLRKATVLQMTGEGTRYVPASSDGIVPLQQQHVPQMIALTQLTNPGPFFERTILFGHYNGLFHAGELVSMAGRRMHLNRYAEISAVCTHPAHAGKGHGSRLINFQVNQLCLDGIVPMLHVMADNAAAINLYERLGFKKRRVMNIYIIQKDTL
jgi:predicted GNAT family acetyltransferase